VKTVRLRVGSWTCVNPDLLRRAFAAIASDYGCAGARLDIAMITPRCRCRDCAASFEPKEFTLRCANCNGGRVELSTGKELEVESIEV